MTDQEWIKAVRKYATEFGSYNFSEQERNRMLLFVGPGSQRNRLLDHRYLKYLHVNTWGAFDLTAAMEQGIIDAITKKLTR